MRGGPWPTITGPADRVAFSAAQARYRRATWRFTLGAALAIAIMGVPLAVGIAPLLFALAFLANDVGQWVTALPDWLVAVGRVIEPALDGHFEPLRALPTEYLVRTAMLVISPGFVGMFLVFLVVWRVVRRGSVGAVLLGVGAREPRADDLEEHQLVNVVQEMAIAAGLPPPGVRVLDHAFPNVAVVGRTPADAVVLVSRGALDRLDRDETQGLVAHAIAQIGNGDLRVVQALLALSQTMIAGGLWISALWGREARRTFFRLVVAAVHPTAARAEAVGAALLSERTLETSDTMLDRARLPGPLIVLLLPFLLLRLATLAGEMAYNMTRIIYFDTFIAGLLARIWSARKLLADATAVELTRQPDGLARAFVRMEESGGFPPEIRWAGPLFVASPGALGDYGGGARQGAFGAIGNADPGLGVRTSRLAAMGAEVSRGGVPAAPIGPVGARRPRRSWLARPWWVFLFLAPFYGLFLVIHVAIMGVAMAIYMLGLGPLVVLGHLAITRGLPWARAALGG